MTLQVIAAIVGIPALMIAILDMGMNGGRYAGAAGPCLVIALPCLAYLWWTT